MGIFHSSIIIACAGFIGIFNIQRDEHMGKVILLDFQTGKWLCVWVTSLRGYKHKCFKNEISTPYCCLLLMSWFLNEKKNKNKNKNNNRKNKCTQTKKLNNRCIMSYSKKRSHKTLSGLEWVKIGKRYRQNIIFLQICYAS